MTQPDAGSRDSKLIAALTAAQLYYMPVSYTHLTLPTTPYV